MVVPIFYYILFLHIIDDTIYIIERLKMKCIQATKIKNNLCNIISEMATNPSLFVVNPSKDFTRIRVFTFKEITKCILSMAENSLNKELYDYSSHNGITATVSAFVQQRDKILPEAFEYLFHEFNKRCKDTRTYKGHRLLALTVQMLISPEIQNQTHILKMIGLQR